ncbi:MAG: hypothetical protein PHE33_10475 [Bacteroidales bacterium]|nr:hypothetical protein [Bacteroidales bacterium]
MKKLIFYFAFVSSMLVLFSSCKKDDDNNDDINNEDNKTKKNYVVAASYGDLISFSIDKENMSYSFNNETTNQTGNGSFVMSPNPRLSGVYEVNQSGTTQYIVEIPDVITITSLQLGNPLNKMAVGLSADLHNSNTYTIADFAGKYLYMNFDDGEKYPGEFWGGTQINSDGTYTVGPGDENITNFSFVGYGNGNMSIDENDNSRILFYEIGSTEPVIGIVLPGKALLIDNGIGNGFSLGVAYPNSPVSQSSLAGSYKGILLTTGSGQGAMNFEIPASGSGLSYYVKFNSGETYDVVNGSSATNVVNSFERVSTLNNVFKMVQTITLDGDPPFESTAYFVMLPGDILMYFGIEEDDQNNEYVAAYGISGKIN